MKVKKLIISVGQILGIALSIFLISFVLFAWTGPTANPPEGNVPGILEILALKLNPDSVSKPTCDESNRGVVWLERGGEDAGDAFETCMKQADGLYAWGTVLDWSYTLFGANPGELDGVDFYDGTASKGMIVFKTPGSYSITPALDGDIEVLVVAGGGGGGRGDTATDGNGAGGGAGGLLYSSSHAIAAGSITVIVGNGGSGSSDSSDKGSSGTNSQFNTLTAIGGGGGGSYKNRDGLNGGSGGGGAINATFAGSGGSGTAGQGSDGADGNSSGYVAGGGGGSGSASSNEDGGSGTSIFGFTYCIGGRGATSSGNGSGNITSISNTGHGGGQRDYKSDSSAYDGSSGIVIVRWGGYSDNYDPTNDSVW